MAKRRHYTLHHLMKFSPAQLILTFYLGAILMTTSILALPFFYQEGVNVPLVDVLFVSVSAISVTGLTTVPIGETFNTAGIIALSVVLHVGAAGLMTLTTFIWMALGKKIGISERQLIMQDQNQTALGGMVQLVRQIVYVLLVVELIGVVLLTIRFLDYYDHFADALLHGFFGTISAISNAGFSIENNSLMDFNGDYYVQSIYMILIIFGAIGFPVLIEVRSFFHHRIKRQRHLFRFSLFTKLTSLTFFLLIVFGTVMIYLLDAFKFFNGKVWHEGLFYALFQSVTTRSSGLSTMDIGQLSEANHLFLSFLMFIGASPSSAGGGIRTTTFALALIFVLTYIRGGKTVKVFNREIYTSDLQKAIVVIIIGIVAVYASTMTLTVIEPFSLTEILLEVTSAFGTVGLSLGITAKLSTVSKFILMILMFIGRIGVVTFLISFRQKEDKNNFHYPKERVIIG
ncbi:MAG TPA: TrkH family potassium uptake protein [Pseudogracilibacillus sp.]|nr:TrkH family potassium uptake protein [Pseudogracilibacillus sp.]